MQKGRGYKFLYVISPTLNNFTTGYANSADDKLMTFFLLFLQKRLWNFMQIVSIGYENTALKKSYLPPKLGYSISCKLSL